MTEKITSRRWLGSAAVTVLLALGLMVTTLAIALSVAERPDDIFSTGVIQLNLNDSQPVITEGEYLFEPGMTVRKSFFLENEGAECWYKLYFADIHGSLAASLEVTVSDGSAVLFSGKLSDLTRERAEIAGSLPPAGTAGSRRDMAIAFHLSEDAGNGAQGGTLSFDLCADGTQVRNNPGKNF